MDQSGTWPGGVHSVNSLLASQCVMGRVDCHFGATFELGLGHHPDDENGEHGQNATKTIQNDGHRWKGRVTVSHVRFAIPVQSRKDEECYKRTNTPNLQ